MDKTHEILLLIILISLFLGLVIVLYLLYLVRRASAGLDMHTQQALSLKDQEMKNLRAVIDALETEREKIAFNIHDEVGPLLATLKLNLSKYKRDLAEGKLRAEELERGQEFIDTIVNNLQTTSNNLSPQFVLKFGLLQALRNLLQSFQMHQIQWETNIENDKFISKQVAINVYRITIELLSNVIKHDNPDEIKVILNREESLLVLTIKHNKPGMNNAMYQAKLGNGDKLGLESIHSRLRIINASINFDKNDNSSEITLIAPLL